MYNAIKSVLGPRITDKLFGNIVDEVQQITNNQILEYLTEEFERNCKTKTILHRVEPVLLSKFYQPLYIRKHQYIFEQKGSESERISTEKVSDLFAKGNFITIIGNAGSGKSTLVKYLFVDSIKSDFKIPLKIELRYLNDYNDSLISYISDEIMKFREIACNDKTVKKMLSSGEFILFLDGYDEISSDKKAKTTKEIEKLTKRYNKNCYILTSRPFVDIDLLESFHNYCICDLSNEEIEKFVDKQFNKDERELAVKIINTIKNADIETYGSFLRNPLLLSMFIITYQTDSHIPQKSSDYYAQVFNTLFSVHDTSSKLGYEREKVSGLTKDGFIDVLKRFSLVSYLDEKFVFNEEYLNSKLNIIKNNISLQFTNDKFIIDLTVAIGILTKEGFDITFSHRSLQEYFAALFIANLASEGKKKMYDKLFVSFSQYNILNYNNRNLYFLLNEMDQDNLVMHITIPFLENICNLVDSKQKVKDITGCFMFIRSNSIIMGDKIQIDFNEKHSEFAAEYEKIFQELIKNSKKRKNSNHDRISFEMREKAKAGEILETKHIYPFFREYDFKSVIINLKEKIEIKTNTDLSFIDSI